MNRLLLILCLIISHLCAAKVLIITHSYNRPDFIEMQHRSFKALLLDEHEYVVFNDAPNNSMRNTINSTCKNIGIRCIEIPQTLHKPRDRANDRHGHCVNYSLDALGYDHDGIVLIIDSDMFLVRPLNIEQYMQNKNIVSWMKGTTPNIEYLCPAFTLLNMNTLPEKKSLRFDTIKPNGVFSADSGGASYYYLQNHPQVTVEHITLTWSYNLFLGNYDIHIPVDQTTSNEVKITKYKELGFNDYEITFMLKQPDTFEFVFNNNFIHYHAGSNHDGRSEEYRSRKFKIFNELIDDAIASFQATSK